MAPLLALHFAATWYMTGVIWVVQVLHYPLLGRTGAAFDECQRLHLARTGWVVGPPMLVEALTGAALLWARPGVPAYGIGMALLALIWGSTFALQVPLHNRLKLGFDAAAHRRLAATNWLRTAAWSARALLLTWLVWGR